MVNRCHNRLHLLFTVYQQEAFYDPDALDPTCLTEVAPELLSDKEK